MSPISTTWVGLAPYLSPPIAASTAIVPVFYGFVVKSALQKGEAFPRLTMANSVRGGINAAPTIGFIIGSQMVTQNLVEKILMKKKQPGELARLMPMVASSMIIGGISAPALAVFNGQTMGRSVRESLRSLSPAQAIAIVIRETSFLFSVRISDPMGKAMKNRYGDHKLIDYSVAFISGATGSIIGHPMDTALTLWQNSMKIETIRQLIRGVFVKSAAVGSFTVCYKCMQEILKPSMTESAD